MKTKKLVKVLITILMGLPVMPFMPSTSWAYMVGTGESLEVHFHMPQPSRVGISPSDTIYLAVFGNVSGSATKAIASLYDGDRLLGTNLQQTYANGVFPFYFYWTDEGSDFLLPSAAPIDASSVVNRSIDGIVKVQFDDSLEFWEIGFGVGYGWLGSISIEGGNAAIVDRIFVSQNSVLEPSSILLVASALIAVLAFAAIRASAKSWIEPSRAIPQLGSCR